MVIPAGGLPKWTRASPTVRAYRFDCSGAQRAPWAAAGFAALCRPHTPCRGAACRSRRCTPDSYWLPLKWYTPIASVAALSERLVHLQIMQRKFIGMETSEFVIARPRRGRGNLAVPGRITGRPRRKRNCLPEIATSAFGLLAMTIRGPLPFYRQPVRIVSAAPGAACRSPTTHDWQFCVTFHFPFCIFHLHHASPLRFALHFITKNCRTRVGAAAERISYLLRAR